MSTRAQAMEESFKEIHAKVQVDMEEFIAMARKREHKHDERMERMEAAIQQLTEANKTFWMTLFDHNPRTGPTEQGESSSQQTRGTSDCRTGTGGGPPRESDPNADGHPAGAPPTAALVHFEPNRGGNVARENFGYKPAGRRNRAVWQEDLLRENVLGAQPYIRAGVVPLPGHYGGPHGDQRGVGGGGRGNVEGDDGREARTPHQQVQGHLTRMNFPKFGD